MGIERFRGIDLKLREMNIEIMEKTRKDLSERMKSECLTWDQLFIEISKMPEVSSERDGGVVRINMTMKCRVAKKTPFFEKRELPDFYFLYEVNKPIPGWWI